MYLFVFFKEIFKISLIILSSFFVLGLSYAQDAEPGDVIITEIFTRSQGNIPDYIELYNKSLYAYSLQNWKISIFGTEYTLNNENSIDALNLLPFKYIIITGRDGYFTDEEGKLHIVAGDERLDLESEEYNSEFASFVANNGEYESIVNAVWAPFALSHSASSIEIISDDDLVIDRLDYSYQEFQICDDNNDCVPQIITGHSIELSNEVVSGIGGITYDPSVGHLPENWEYSQRSRPFMFSTSSDQLYETGDLFLEFGSPGKRNYLSSVIALTNLNCGIDESSEPNQFCTSPDDLCVIDEPIGQEVYNTEENCEAAWVDDVDDYWEVKYVPDENGIDQAVNRICWYPCIWNDTPQYLSTDDFDPTYRIYHDRFPGGTKSFIFDADSSKTHPGDNITSYKWYKNGSVFQNGLSIESEFSQGLHELVLIVKNEDDIWAVDTFNFEIIEPNSEPKPIISVDATEYVVAHNGDPSPAATGITLSGVNSCDCNDFIRHEFLTYGFILPDDSDCECIPVEVDESDTTTTVEPWYNPDWLNALEEECVNKTQSDCQSEEFSDYCWWNPDGEDTSVDTPFGACEHSEIEYFFWTKDGVIQGTSKEFVSYIPDIGDYVFSLILTDTYGENNSASENIRIKKELNYPPIVNIIGETTNPNFSPSNGIPYDTEILDLDEYNDSEDEQLPEGQSIDDVIFSQWYTIDGIPIDSDDTEQDAHEIRLGLGTYTFILEVLDSYNCYSKSNYGDFLNMCGTEPCVELCYGIESESECTDIYSGCRWFENECTPYCELYAQGFCDGLGELPHPNNPGSMIDVRNDTPCHFKGVNVTECGIGGSCIFNDEYCSNFNNQDDCRCGDGGEWDIEFEECEIGEEFEYCNWVTTDENGFCKGDLQSASYDTLTVILSEENSPPIVDIGTNLFGYMELNTHLIVPSVYDIEFYNGGSEGYCLPRYNEENTEEYEKCDPTIPPLFDSREEKCCLQVEWEVEAYNLGGEDSYCFSLSEQECNDTENNCIYDLSYNCIPDPQSPLSTWYQCSEPGASDEYCDEILINPYEKDLQLYPPQNVDFYPDYVKLKLTATDPFFNAGYSDIAGQDEVIIIIENDNKAPVQYPECNDPQYDDVQFDDDCRDDDLEETCKEFEQNGYIIIEDDSTTFVELNLCNYFIDPDGEDLRFDYMIPNNQLIDTNAIALDPDYSNFIANDIILKNFQDKTGDVEFYIYALDSEFQEQASFSISIVPKNDFPNIYNIDHTISECTSNCDIDDQINSHPFELDGDPGGCGEDYVPQESNSNNCEDGILTYHYDPDEHDCRDNHLTEKCRTPYFGDIDSTEFGIDYFPYENFFGYDTLFYQIRDIGSSAGIVDTLWSNIGHIVFYVDKSDNSAPIVQKKDFTIMEDHIIHFTVSEDSINYINTEYCRDYTTENECRCGNGGEWSTYNDGAGCIVGEEEVYCDWVQDDNLPANGFCDSYNHVYVGLDILDDDNDCTRADNPICNDPLYSLDQLEIIVDPGVNNQYYTRTDTNYSVIIIDANYNNSLVVPLKVRDNEIELGNEESQVDTINITLTAVNDKPYAADTELILNEDGFIEFELDGNDVESNSLSYEVIQLPTKLESIYPNPQESENILFDFGETPSLTFYPLNNFNGKDTLKYVIHDDGTTNEEPDPLTSDIIQVEMTINQVNDPPQIDEIYFVSNSTLQEDESNIQLRMIYTDIDSDEELNVDADILDLQFDFNNSYNENGLKFWFKEQPPQQVEEIDDYPYLAMEGIITIDSLLKNWNGTDTSIIKITDIHGLVKDYIFELTVEAVNDPPTISSIKVDTAAIDTLNLWEYNYDPESDEVLIAEDSKNIPLIIEYFDVDIDSTLNVNPDTIADFTWSLSSMKNKFVASDTVVYSEDLGEDIFEFKIDSITNNWNGYDSLVTIITDELGDSSFDTLGLQIYQINDNPEPFNYFSQLNEYPFDLESNYFYENGNEWVFRLPYQEYPISNENPEELLIKWKRTTDIDLVDSLNNHVNRIKDLFYRIELSGDKSGYTYVLKSRINDSLFNYIDYCMEDLEVTRQECDELGIIDTTYGFSKIDLTQTFLTYKGSYFDSLFVINPDTIYKNLDLTNNKYYYCDDNSGIAYGASDCNNNCPESCANTDYKLNIVAYNASRNGNPDDPGGSDGYDFNYNDMPQYADLMEGDSANFNLDLKLPDFQFNVIRNDIFWEYYDLYITNSEDILSSIEGSDYNPVLIIQYSDEVIDTVERTSSEHGPIHYTSQFMSEDSITFIYSARDRVQNYGVSSKTISYAIVEPMTKTILSTPSQNSQISFQIGSVSEITGIIAQDIDIISDNLNAIGVSFLPQHQPIVSNVKLSFNIDLIGLPNGNSWNYELYKKINGNWENQNVQFEKLNDFIFTDINNLGEFTVLYNENAIKPIPSKFVMYPNYPNPFNGSTTIRFEIPNNEIVTLNIINILGENVRSIYSGSLPADFYSFNWDGLDNKLNSVSSGIYFIQLELKNKKHLQKIMYMK